MLGVRLVDGQGQVVSNGGRVMKNVTGIDLVKLMAGSYGTLGVLSEISFKVLPAPKSTAVLLFTGLDDTQAIAAMSDALGSPYDVSSAAHLPVGLDGDPLTMIRLEGLDASVEYRAAALAAHLAPHGTPEVERDPAKTAAGWRYIRDVEVCAGREGAVWRLSVKPGDAPGLVDGLRAAGMVDGVVYDWGGGLVWLLVAEAGDAQAIAIRAAMAEVGGHATLIRASAATRAAIAVLQPEPEPLARISAGLRARFDPKGILNPGRIA
jgi:glycolate oxidase FAD binding subunit